MVVITPRSAHRIKRELTLKKKKKALLTSSLLLSFFFNCFPK